MVRARWSRLWTSQLASAGNRRDRPCRRPCGPPSTDAGVIGLVDQHARQRVAVELDMPAAVGRGAHEDVRHHGLRPRARRTPGRAWDRAGGSRRSCRRDPRRRRRRRAQRGEIALGEEVEMVDQRLHRRIEAVALAQLDREAFGEIAGADARADRSSAAPPAPPRPSSSAAPSRSATSPRSPAGSRPRRPRRSGSGRSCAPRASAKASASCSAR